MRKISLLVIVMALVPQEIPRAGDFWNERPYGEWKAEEIVRMLTDSPWCRTTAVRLPEQSIGDSWLSDLLSNPQDSKNGQSCGSCKAIGNEKGDTADRAAKALATAGPLQTPGTNPTGNVLFYRVLWLSSVRVRQAMNRALQLQGVEPAETSKQEVERPFEDLAIGISGPWMGPFEELSADFLKKHAALRSVKSKHKQIRPSGYVPPGQRRDRMALFIFPRLLDGKPAFDPADREVEFTFDKESFWFKARFKLERMMVKGALDL
jgi:hypothetical protein